ncbi:hypothetical protein [Coleofasciculus sp. H7-2]|uniref:hypothetical protein n=1 Tax=Coleofasciculus sp. H7-2 TaxID=3351545 RepID=UPI0036734C4E
MGNKGDRVFHVRNVWLMRAIALASGVTFHSYSNYWKQVLDKHSSQLSLSEVTEKP